MKGRQNSMMECEIQKLNSMLRLDKLWLTKELETSRSTKKFHTCTGREEEKNRFHKSLEETGRNTHRERERGTISK